MDTVIDVNKNFLLKFHQKSRNKANKNFLWKVHQKSRKKTKKKFLLKVHQKPRPKKWLGIREVNEISSIEIPAEERHNDETTDAATDLGEPAREEE